ncbi:MAG: DoxX family protein [Flavobacteriales bacterium]|nr:DoxX family protein [Flavobacteriales bacterium]MBL6872955.1 DoxX family protein [Flavobacteriales bacterium]
MKLTNFFLKLIVAIIFIQSLFFKFSGHPQAIHIFSTLNMEPFGRVGIGCIELICALLFFIPRFSFLATIGSLVLMLGAVFFHLTTDLGIVVNWNGESDYGKLFSMAVIVIILCIILIYLNLKSHLSTNPKVNKN